MKTEAGEAEGQAGEAGAVLATLRTARAVRDGAERVLAEGLAGRLEHFEVHLEALPALAGRVVQISRSTYPDLRAVPIHGRYRHFGVGGTDRLALLDERLAGATVAEKLLARADLVITSVLLDAGAGAAWSYREPASGKSFNRSEGLAVASHDWFAAGGLSGDGEHPLRVDASRLRALDVDAVARAFQVRPDNPLLGLPGRVAVLRALGHAIESDAARFGAGVARPGQLAVHLLGRAHAGVLPAEEILSALLGAFGAIWPGRESLDGVALGDVWTHSRLGRLPFHKLSQWLAYSLVEPLEQAGLRVTDIDALTGLPEYRNGGLFIDGGVLRPRHRGVLEQTHAIGSDVIIEWRALTVALLDRIAEEMRQALGLTALELPLAKVLEAGTWRAGRVLALEKRSDGGPPIQIVSDGTVF
jgi:hypothetical protein